MSQEDDNRNKAAEAAGTAVVGAGLLGGLLFGAKAIGDAIKGHNARSNEENIVSYVSSGQVAQYEEECDYDCSGWPYKECKVTKTFKYGGFKSATCISPYSSRSSYRMYSNYPECATIPSECERCDDVCSQRDYGLNKYDYTEIGPQYPVPEAPTPVYEPPAPTPVYEPEAPTPVYVPGASEPRVCDDYGFCLPPLRVMTAEEQAIMESWGLNPTEDCSGIKGRRVCCSDDGECSRYTGPDPTPWQRAKFTSCEYSDGHLQCDFSNDCSEMPNGRMVCCDDGGDCSAYVGPDPRDPLCRFISDSPFVKCSVVVE